MPLLSYFNNLLPQPLIVDCDSTAYGYCDWISRRLGNIQDNVRNDNIRNISDRLELNFMRLTFEINSLLELSNITSNINKRLFIIVNNVIDLGNNHRMRCFNFMILYDRCGIVYINELDLLSFKPFDYDHNLFIKTSLQLDIDKK